MEDLRPWEALPGVPLANEQFIGWENVPIDSIRLDPAATQVVARYTESDQSFDQFVASIAKWGIAEDVIVSRLGEDKHVIIDGVRRFRAAIRLGLPSIPCMVYGPMTETERRDLRDVLYFVGMEFKRRARAEMKIKRTLRRARDLSLEDGLAA
jgi:ParB-like chromosome segregation protein Spo0J